MYTHCQPGAKTVPPSLFSEVTMKRVGSVLAAAVFLACTAFAGPVFYTVSLSGPAESPPNASPGTGFATVSIDTVAHTLFIDLSFSGLLGTTTASHIHCCATVPLTGTAGVATQTPFFVGFPIGVTAGTYTNTFDTTDLATFNAAFVTANGGTAAGAEAALAAGMAAGEAYLNIRTDVFPGGEIRGFLIPEPATFGVTALGLAGLPLMGRSSRYIRRTRL